MNHPICRITSIEHTAPYSLRLCFNDGLTRPINFEPILEGELLAPSATRRYLLKSHSTRRFIQSFGHVERTSTLPRSTISPTTRLLFVLQQRVGVTPKQTPKRRKIQTVVSLGVFCAHPSTEPPKQNNENNPQTSARLHGALHAHTVSSPWPESRLQNKLTNRCKTATSPGNMGGSSGGRQRAPKNHHHCQRQFIPLSPGYELLV